MNKLNPQNKKFTLAKWAFTKINLKTIDSNDRVSILQIFIDNQHHKLKERSHIFHIWLHKFMKWHLLG